jgi:uncharacterized phage protein gp47/JayE
VQISLQNFTMLVQNMSASAQGACAQFLDFTVGSVTRALIEATASVALWLQFLILQILSMSRLATSNGADVDSWVGDFGLSRLPGTFAVGSVVMTSLSPQNQSGLVPIGTTIRTADGQLTFAVSLDVSNPAWSQVAKAYLRTAGSASITVPAQALVAGSMGNVQANTINLLGQSLVGIDVVTNPLPFTTGQDAETDASLRSRFVAYINSRSRATVAAIVNAAVGCQAGLSAVVLENTDSAGSPVLGTFTVVVDDGSGSPPATLLSTVASSIDQVRPVGSSFFVIPPLLIDADIALTLSVRLGSDKAMIGQAVTTALVAFIDSLPVGGVLRFSRIASIAYQTDTNVSNVSGVTLNGAMSDLGGAPSSVVRPGSIVVS